MAFDKIVVQSTKDLFINQIEGKIISGELPVGSKLPSERQLAEEMGVTKSVAHFALKELENSGFVRVEPRRGVYVADFARHGNFKTLNELLKLRGTKVDDRLTASLVELRNAVEGGALIKLGKEQNPQALNALQRIIDELKALILKNEATDEKAAAHTVYFHYMVCELSGNDMFPMMMNAFDGASALLWRRYANYWHAEKVNAHEQRTLDLVKAGKGHEAARYIEKVFDDFMAADNRKDSSSIAIGGHKPVRALFDNKLPADVNWNQVNDFLRTTKFYKQLLSDCWRESEVFAEYPVTDTTLACLGCIHADLATCYQGAFAFDENGREDRHEEYRLLNEHLHSKYEKIDADMLNRIYLHYLQEDR